MEIRTRRIGEHPFLSAPRLYDAWQKLKLENSAQMPRFGTWPAYPFGGFSFCGFRGGELVGLGFCWLEFTDETWTSA